MKKLWFGILAVIALVNVAFADLDSTAGAYWEYDTVVSNVRVTGTTAGTIVSKRAIEPGWDYVFQYRDSVGGTTDSAFTTLIIYSKDGSTVIDSTDIEVHKAADARFGTVRLPIGFSKFGLYMTLKFTRYNATNKTNLVRGEIVKRSHLETNIDYKRKH